MFVVLTGSFFFGFKAYKNLRRKERKLLRRELVKNAVVVAACATLAVMVLLMASFADQL
jgi:hypothetical protein